MSRIYKTNPYYEIPSTTVKIVYDDDEQEFEGEELPIEELSLETLDQTYSHTEEEKIASTVKDEIVFYDYDNEVIDAPYNKINPNKVYGMAIKSRKAIEAVRDYFGPLGYIIPDDFDTEESGCWVWSDPDSDWLRVEEEIEEIEKRLEDYNKMLEVLEDIKKIKNRG